MSSVIITGCSGGMGLATSKKLIELGYEVFGLDTKPIESFDHFHFIKADVTKQDEINSAFNLIKYQVKEIDAIINFAGITELNSLIEMKEEDFVNIFNTNLFGVYRVNKTFVPLLKEKGKIFITSSELAPLDPLPFNGIYAISKSALDKYAYSLRMELQLLGYQVIVIRPGAVDTDMINISNLQIERFVNETTTYKEISKKFKQIVESVEARKIPPERIALLVSKVLKKKNPKYIYKINRNPLLMMMNILPKRWQNKLIKRILSK
ncbi:MAG: SDR family NAD(P)-dependent oxidoreductase [Bacilli bacterium]|nr:SDR family NAD(P)-dependent oxidoreductase [Bacilli bacterium]